MQLPAAVHRYDLPVVRQFLKYGVVGASNTILTFVIYSALVLLHVDYLAALVFGYFVGSLNSYILNRRWTFRAGHLAHTVAGTRFAVVQGCAIVANLALLYLFVHDLHLPRIASQAILTIPVLAVTFFINRAWSFAHPTSPPPPPVRR
jgi:putative flippase GtrA